MKSRNILQVVMLCAVLLGAADAMSLERLPDSSPSGILVDRVLPMAHLEDLDGTPGSATVDLSRWRQAVHELSRAAEAPLGWPDPREMSKQARLAANSQDVALAILWAAYDRLSDEGESQVARVFAFTPLQQDIYHGQNLVFTVDPQNILTHRSERIISWALDAGDGQGWVEFFLGGQGIPVSYDQPGPKTLRLMVELDDGRLVFGSAVLNVKRLLTPDPTDTWFITASESYGGSVASGLAHLYLAEEHTTLTNPVVVVEGFDLDNSMDWPVLYDLLNQENLLEDLRTMGFDAVVLDFTEATEPIQRNAFVLAQLLSQVREVAGPEASIALIGASMGGLVSRYGLTWLESQGVDHGVRSLVCFDSPQTGANIPLGLQYWLNFFKDESTDAGFLLSRLNTPAAKQMLLYHYTEPQSAPGPDPLLADFHADLAGLGNWPAQPRLVAVANGRGMSTDQGFAAGQQLIFYEYRSLLADIDGNVWAVPDEASQTIFDGMINLIWPLPDTYQTVTVGGTLPWDNAPGGYRLSLAQMDTTAVPYGDIVALHDAHCFVPTVSALALDVADPFFDIDGASDLLQMTPFDAVYYPSANQEHIAITAENKAWLMAEIQTDLTPAQDQPALMVSDTVLYPAAPNPFNPSTEISFRVGKRAEVSLKVYDLSGRLVRTLVPGVLHNPGIHTLTWTGDGDGGNGLPSGVYLCQLQVKDEVKTRRLTLLK